MPRQECGDYPYCEDGDDFYRRAYTCCCIKPIKIYDYTENTNLNAFGNKSIVDFINGIISALGSAQ